jgi:hypothetical protein
MERKLLTDQEQFNMYLRQLPLKEPCQFMLAKIMNHCSDESFKCPYRGFERFESQHNLKECKREKMTKFERFLQPKKVNPFMMHGH